MTSQCTAVAIADVPDDGTVDLRELGEAHDDGHAALATDLDPWGAVFFRWSESGYRFEAHPWCAVVGWPREHACSLYVSHSGPHRWAVTDPADEASHVATEKESFGRWPGLFQRKPATD
ncbi:hypothetical protein [Streptomyces zagrosensis]|uniref:Uncharacterized protein n=1 Tax=Streptomyces zagrosensis TaxID=1042984 RepID=A0A7W9QB44_9ACTN|nr:hypothetical protein [Streptomyces zagrosensis]MBB5936729.1 hypothetical protein [Streptomyces zagrosensis]